MIRWWDRGLSSESNNIIDSIPTIHDALIDLLKSSVGPGTNSDYVATMNSLSQWFSLYRKYNEKIISNVEIVRVGKYYKNPNYF